MKVEYSCGGGVELRGVKKVECRCVGGVQFS